MTAPPDWPTGKYGAILADPPWRFKVWSGTKVVQSRKSKTTYWSAAVHYHTMPFAKLERLPVSAIAAKDCVLLLWVCSPLLPEALRLIEVWGFAYKTLGFNWCKGAMGMGYWTRASTELCLLAAKGHPKRLNADVRQEIIEPRREHSRKPDCVYERIERLVAGPYLELFARTTRPGWTAWGNEVGKFKSPDSACAASAAGA